ncbi:hypothetical protein EBR21_00440 [bacterium]|nr:hypothetical protein [bacterium]
MIFTQRPATHPRNAKFVIHLSSIVAVVALQSCSTVEPGTGRCKAFKDPKYVASSSDTDGKPWTITITPDSIELKCDYSGSKPIEGLMTFTAVVKDGQGFAKPALAVNSGFSGSATSQGATGFFGNPDGKDDVATDSCGTAVFTVRWVCPAPKKTAGSYFYVTSGPLASKSVKVTLEHIVQPDTAPVVVK